MTEIPIDQGIDVAALSGAPALLRAPAARVLALLRDGRVWRLSDLRAALGKGSDAVGELVAIGLVARVGWGQYLLAGTPRPASADADEMPATSPADRRVSPGDRVLALLRDGRVWRTAEICAALGDDTGQRAVAGLVAGGKAIKVRAGQYALAGVTPTPLAPALRPGSARARILDLLEQGPRSARQLSEAIGVSSQAVYQALASLLQASQVERHERLYLLPGRPCPPSRAPALSSRHARTLSAMPAGGTVAWRDISAAIRHGGDLVRDLAGLGLLELSEFGRYRVVRLTPRGLDHHQYDGAAAKVKLVDLAELLGAAKLRIVLVVHVLQEVTSRDIALLTGAMTRRAGGAGAAQHLHRLVAYGMVDVARTTGRGGGVRHYRLSGRCRDILALGSEGLVLPTRTALRRRLKAARARHRRHIVR